MFARIAHAVNCVCSDRQEDLLGIRLFSATVQRKSDRCLRPAVCMLARHTNDGSKSSQQEAGSRASPWQAPGFVCFPSPYMYALSPFRSNREGSSSKILKGKARTLAASLSAWSVLLKLPYETRVNLELVWPPFRLSMCNGRRAEAERKELKIAFGPQTNIAFGPKTKSCRRARQFFFSVVSLSHSFSCSWWRKRGQTIRGLRRASTNPQTQKPAVISVCIRLMLGGGDWKPSLFKWEIQHLLKSMGFDAGSRLGGGDWKPSLFKWEIQHLLKSMGFDAGSGSEGWSEKSPPLAGRWALINPAECHQRCWAEVHDPPGMPNFYGWRHGVGRSRLHSKRCLGVVRLFLQPGVVLIFRWNSSLAVLRQTVLRHPTVP